LRRNPPAKPAVRGISLKVGRGELVALVGQSGCGKSSTLQAVLGMQQVLGGKIEINNRNITTLDTRGLRLLRRNVQMVYQDPYESLDIRFRVRDTVIEPLRIHRICKTRHEREKLAQEALEQVGLVPAHNYMARFPHELSGGQRQRVAIAASIVLKPKLLLADEPVSMLDVSVRTGILDLLAELCRESGVGVLMITHDLSTAANYADRIAVMKDGLIIEQGPTASVLGSPSTAYTKELIASIPNPDPDHRT
jgi:peptide/nickel transport system ATP-binding protein